MIKNSIIVDIPRSDLFEKSEIVRSFNINNLWNFLCIKILNYCICMRAWNNRKKEKKVIDAEQDNWDIQFINAIIYFSCQVVFTLQPVSQEEIKTFYWFSTSRNLPLCHAIL